MVQHDAFQSETDAIRDELLAQHFGEWQELEGYRAEAMGHLGKGLETDSMERVKMAKLALDAIRSSAQTLGMRHQGERRAKRIPDFEQQTDAGQVRGWVMNL